jgi:RNA polymerase sigma-70 factor, ECF subfamily
MVSDSERLLIQQIRNGDPAAWEQLVDRYQGRLFRFIRKWIQDSSTAEDLIQNTFIGFLNSLPNYDEKRDLQKWLFTIAKNKVTDHLRREGRRPAGTGAEEQLNEKAGGQRAASSIARSREDREKEQSLLHRVLSRMIQEWKQKEDFLKLEVMELLFVKGWANYQVAKQLGIPDQQVANIRFAALKKLKEELTAAGSSITMIGATET